MFVQRFMFRKRRNSLTRRLEKAIKRRLGDESRRCSPAVEDEAKSLLKRLNYEQLEILWRAVDSLGREATNCVLLPPQDQPHVLCCQTWRWPDVLCGQQLKRLPFCSSANDPVYICCNPYHWSRVCLPDFPPPPYSRFAMDTLKPEDRAPSEVPLVCRDTFLGSLTTEDTLTNPREWCKLAYWEMTQRVGPLFPVEMHSVNVFGDVPIGDGLCLKTLALHSFSPPESVYRTRCKIGLGVTLSREDDGIWMYNRSENPVFVNSRTLEEPESQSPIRVPPEHCLCIFDPVKAAYQCYGWSNFSNSTNGPVNEYSVRISFVKGWGRQYTRQEITSCPCWLEILLAPCR